MGALIAKEYRTVAILTRTLREAKELHEELSPTWPMLNLIDGRKGTYQGGYSVLPVYLSKGLEFDAVVVADADRAHYAEKAWDAKLMYVGCTRALHELWLLHGEPLPSYIMTEASEIMASGWPAE